MPRKANTARLETGRIVNSATTRVKRSQGSLKRLNDDLQLVEPREIRNLLKKDLKDLRSVMLESRPNAPGAAKKAFNRQTVKDRKAACSQGSVRFITPGSRDPKSDVLPGCYGMPKGHKLGGKKKKK